MRAGWWSGDQQRREKSGYTLTKLNQMSGYNLTNELTNGCQEK
jgi:hypothetical protein